MSSGGEFYSKVDKFNELMDSLKALHERKNHDYANNENPFQNFTRAEALVSWFSDDLDKVFATLIGVKLARLGELMSTGKQAKNESVSDSFDDIIVYMGIWKLSKDIMSQVSGASLAQVLSGRP